MQDGRFSHANYGNHFWSVLINVIQKRRVTVHKNYNKFDVQKWSFENEKYYLHKLSLKSIRIK